MTRERGPVGALCLVQFVDVLGVTVVITALPSMLADLHIPASAATPVVTGYAMLFGGLLMLGARLGDRYGHRRVLVLGLVAFGAASVAAATSVSLTELVIARCMQGAAAAGSVPAALRLLSAVATDEDNRRRALAAWSATGAAAGASGLLLGGVLTDLAGWRTVFWLNLPLAVLLVIAALRTVPRTPVISAGRLDLPGALLLTGAVMGLVLGCALLEQAEHRPAGAALTVSGLFLLVVFRWAERRSADPLLPAAAARHRNLRIGAAGSLLNTATTSSVITLATLYLQNDRGLSPAAAGIALLPFSVLVAAAAAVGAPRLLRALTPRTVIGLGLGLIAVGDAALLTLPAITWLLPVSVGIAGAGIGLSSVAATTIGTDVPDNIAGTAAGVLNTAAQLGTVLGVALIVLIASTTDHLPLGGSPLGLICAALLAAAGALGIGARSRNTRDDLVRTDSTPASNRQPVPTSTR